jgi:phosphatidylglycerol---prolipoprotein diacylglyceryl transferase
VTHLFIDINPIAFSLGPVQVHWYGIMYLIGFAAAWWLGQHRRAAGRLPVTAEQFSDLAFYAMLGVILGGRIGYMVFYDTSELVHHPASLFRVWEGGMSFHGGFLGVIVATIAFSLRNKTDPFLLGDLLAIVSPIGLFFGRLANFINGELWGRTTDVAWAMVFPRGGPLPRHPSQLYQAFFEGIALFAVMMLVWRLTDGRHRPGLLTGVFFAGYGVARIVGELFREPDAHLGYLWGPITMGMLLSVPLLFIGAWLITRAYARPAVS